MQIQRIKQPGKLFRADIADTVDAGNDDRGDRNSFRSSSRSLGKAYRKSLKPTTDVDVYNG
jgi:hypothetical protein